MYTYNQIKNALELAPGFESGQHFAQTLYSANLSQLTNAPCLQSLLLEIKTEARRVLETPVASLPFSLFKAFEATGERHGYEKLYFERRGRLAALALASLIESPTNYLAALEDVIWEICNEYTWALPAHLSKGNNTGRETDFSTARQTIDLFAAETAHTLAEISILLSAQLNPAIISRIRNEIETRVFNSLFFNPTPFWWETATFNWSAVCAGSIGMSAMLLVENRQRLAGMLERIIRILECYLEGFGDDGGCAEGVSYWQYGFGYYVYFAEMLYEYTKGELNLFQGAKIIRIAQFPAVLNLAGQYFVNYSDSSAKVLLHSGLVSRLSERLNLTENLPYLQGVPSFHSDSCYRWGHLSRNLFWTKSAILQKNLPSQTVYLANLGVVVSRSYLQQTPLVFSAKGGHNDEPHNHNDLGNFILFIGQESLLAELGAGVYSRQYFGAERYDFLHNSALGHSVPIINGQVQQAGRNHKASVAQFQQHASGLIFQLDLAEAYAVPGLKNYKRTFAWQVNPNEGKAELLLTDYFNFETVSNSGSIAIEEIFISLRQPRLEPVEGVVSWAGESGEVRLVYSPASFKPIVQVITTINHAGDSVTVYRLHLSLLTTQPSPEFKLVFRFECTPLHHSP